MKSTSFKKFILFFILLSLIGCKASKFFEKGSAHLPTSTYVIPIQLTNNLPLVNVKINGKEYVFLLDTGAPTVISHKVYQDLDLKRYMRQKVSDSHNISFKQDFVVLPEIYVDSIRFENIGAVVMDLQAVEFFCHDIDGIIGANQMAKLAWKIDYEKGTAVVANDFADLSFHDVDFKIPFEARGQKTPYIEFSYQGNDRKLTFDTGFAGALNLNDKDNKIKQSIPDHQKISTFGIGSVGAYGEGKTDTAWHLLLTDPTLGQQQFDQIIVSTAAKNLLGNTFLKRYEFVVDWKEKWIYFREKTPYEAKLTGFGFGYRFVDRKPTVVSVLRDTDQKLELGDVILSINSIDLRHLDDNAVCHYIVNRIETDSDSLQLQIQRNEQVLNYILSKKVLLE